MYWGQSGLVELTTNGKATEPRVLIKASLSRWSPDAAARLAVPAWGPVAIVSRWGPGPARATSAGTTARDVRPDAC